MLAGKGKVTLSDGSAADVTFEWSEPAPAAPPAGTGLYVVNLVLFIFVGICFSVWLAAYTQYFSVFTTALGFGGVLVWVAFLGQMIRDERKEQLKKWLDEHVLDSAGGTVAAILCFIAIASGAVFYATIGLVSREDGVVRPVRVSEIDESGVEREIASDVIAPRATARILVRPGAQQRRYLIRASGLPLIARTIGPTERVSLTVPGSFLGQPVALIRIPAVLAHTAAKQRNHTLHISVRRKDEKARLVRIDQYSGRTVWLGCDESVPIPRAITDKWKDADQPTQWRRPLTPMRDLTVQTGDVVTVELRNAKGTKLAGAEVTIQLVEQLTNGIQEIDVK